MAFVSQSQRVIEAFSRGTFMPGPGSYNPAQLLENPNYGYAPFLSTSSRKVFNQEKIAPGPGSYNSFTQQWCPNITTYSNENNVILKLHQIGTQPFLSKSNRFGNQQGILPGPGYYNFQCDRNKRKNLNGFQKRRKSVDFVPKKPKQPQLYIQKAVVVQQHFIPVPQQKKGVLAGLWSRDKRDRFENTSNNSVGPGTYEINRPKKDSKKRISLSHEFLSTTVRTFDQIVYKAKNQESLLLKLSNHSFKSQQPCPGTYNLSKNKNTDAENYKNHSFGSTNKRFEKCKTQQTCTIDFYDISKKTSSTFQKKKVPFNSESKRLVSYSVGQQLPGPGYYTIQRQKFSSFPKRSIQCFGSTSKKQLQQTVATSNGPNIGPGSYEVEAKKQQFTSKSSSSIFKSRVPQFWQKQQQGDKKFASYDINKYDLNRKLQAQMIHRENLQKIDSLKPAFGKGSPRFKHYETEPSQPKLTSQEIQNLLQYKKYIEREAMIELAHKQKQVKSNIGNQQRFKRANPGPGVGDYTLRCKWNKKSYNTKYKIGQI